MRIRMFRAGDGRSLLIDGRHPDPLLVDGGTAAAYRKYIAPALQDYTTLGWVCVSAPILGCVDGVRQMLDDAVSWRVYEYQHADGEKSRYRRPLARRPPVPAAVWFNPLDAMLGRTTGELQAELATYASWFARRDGSSIEERVVALLRESQQLAKRLNQLQVRSNEAFDGGLVHVRRAAKPMSVGGLEVHLLGPHHPDIDQARAAWNTWFREAAEAPLQLIARQAAGGAHASLSAAPAAVSPASPAEPIERRSAGIPSIPSQLFLVTEAGASVLLAGLATGDEVLRGLVSQGWTDANGLARVSALEVPVGGGARVRGEFFKRIIADDYLFHGDSATIAAAPEILDALFAARADLAGAGDGRVFRLWIACTLDDESGERAAAIRRLQTLVEELVKASNGRAACRFLRSRAPSLEVPVGSKRPPAGHSDSRRSASRVSPRVSPIGRLRST